MENKSEQQHLQRSYLSAIHSKPHMQITSLPKQLTAAIPKQRTYRTRTNIYNIDCISQEQIDQIIRKNSYVSTKKCKTIERSSLQSKCTPYQNRKNNQKSLFKDKKQKIISQMKKIPLKLQQSKNNWLIVKQALSNGKKVHLRSQTSSQRKQKRQHLKSQASSQRINIDLSDIICEQQNTKNIKQKEPLQNDKNRCIKRMLSYYKNKNVIKHNLQANKKTKERSQKKEQINLNLKLSTISNNINQTKRSLNSNGFQDRFKYLYASKRKIAIKNKTKHYESAIPTENLKANLVSSTHSDQIQKICNDTLNGVLNSFKVDMKQKQQIKPRPKTASRVFKTAAQLKKNKNGSTKLIQMTGWQDQTDKYQRDIAFFP